MVEEIRHTGSIVIADFLGWGHHGDTYQFPNLYPAFNTDDEENTGWTEDSIDSAQFHCSLDWLQIPVHLLQQDVIDPKIMDNIYVLYEALEDALISFDEEQIFEALVECIKQLKK